MATKEELDAKIAEVSAAVAAEKEQLEALKKSFTDAMAALQAKIDELTAQLGQPVDLSAEVDALNAVKDQIEALVP